MAEVSFRQRDTEPRRPKVVKRFRDSHHMVARFFAMGYRPGQVAKETGYCQSRISILQGDPAFRDLIETYREDVHGEWRDEARDYFSQVNRARNMTMRQIVDQLAEADEEGADPLPIRTLKEIHADLADRSGYPKRTEVFTKDMDFAALMDKAIEKSQKVLDLRPEPKATVEHRTATLEHRSTLLRQPDVVVEQSAQRLSTTATGIPYPEPPLPSHAASPGVGPSAEAGEVGDPLASLSRPIVRRRI